MKRHSHNIYTFAYQEHLLAFSRHINLLGYKKPTRTIIIFCAKEFLHYLEQEGINRIETVKPIHIKSHYKYLNERPNLRREGGLSSSIVTFHIYAIRLFLTYLQKENIIKADPMGNLTFERVAHKEREILTQKEIQKLYKASETLRDKAMLSLLYGLGLRSAEASGLDIMDIHFASRILYVRHGKGDKPREVPMAEQVAEHLKDYYHNERGGFTRSTNVENAFILNNHARRAGGQWMWLRLKYLVAKAGIKDKTVTLHTLRHSIATHLLENGMSIEYVKTFLGHASLGSTQIYTHIVQKHLNTLKI